MKSLSLLSAALLCSLCFVSCSDNQTTQHELTAIKQQLTQLNKKIDQLVKAVKKDKQTPKRRNDRKLFTRQGSNTEKLEKITLPNNPTKQQIISYIRKIYQASANQKIFSANDIQVAMLMDVGNENIELLLKSANISHSFYKTYAIERLAEDKDKALILKYLPVQNDLVKIIIQKGWEEDAKQILYDKLKITPSYLPVGWIRATANLQDPVSYKWLIKYLILGSNKSFTYNIIKWLPGIELTDAVEKAWLNAAYDDNIHSRNNFAPIAASYGNIDALGVIIDSLGSPRNDYESVRNPRKYIIKYTNVTGSNDEIKKWYKKNKSRLKFDSVAKKFIVKK